MNRTIHYAIPYDRDLMARARSVPGAHWNKGLKLWEAPERRAAWLALEAAGLLDRVVGLPPAVQDPHLPGRPFGKTAKAAPVAVRDVPRRTNEGCDHRGAETATGRRELLELRETLMREGAAHATVKAYVGIVRQLQRWWARPLNEVTRADLLSYMTHCIERKHYGRATMNQVVNGTRAYYERVLGWPPDELRLPRQKKKRALPNVCSEEQVRRMLREVGNAKHRTILATVYGLGLRRGEVQRLMVGDVDLERGVVHVRQSKGNKDRVLGIPRSLRQMLEDYIRRYRPDHWFFVGQDGGQYSATSIQKVFTRAKERSGLPKQLTLHGLRHSYATLLKSGAPAPHSFVVEHDTALHVIQNQLGHGSIETTRIYLHTSSKQLADLYDPLGEL